jgi:hypothetical protein
MIRSISEDQLCQAFDPIMIIPEKTNYIIDDPMKANTSCVAPASVYIEGSRGKRFLCDYHYHYEKNITLVRTPEQWAEIAKIVIDERDLIRESFPELSGKSISDSFKRCWCGYSSLVKATRKDNGSNSFFCNFHYRKLFFRYLSNGRQMTDDYNIVDERIKLKLSVSEEAEQLINI